MTRPDIGPDKPQYVHISKDTLDNIKIMAFSSQLRRLYRVMRHEGKIKYVAGICGPYFMLHSLYDYLTEKGFKIEFKLGDNATQDEVKKHLWNIAYNNSWLQVLRGTEQSARKELQIKLYKSELLYLCLVQLYNVDGKELSFDNADGSKRSPINFMDDSTIEDNIIKYLEDKAKQLL